MDSVQQILDIIVSAHDIGVGEPVPKALEKPLAVLTVYVCALSSSFVANYERL